MLFAQLRNSGKWTKGETALSLHQTRASREISKGLSGGVPCLLRDSAAYGKMLRSAGCGRLALCTGANCFSARPCQLPLSMPLHDPSVVCQGSIRVSLRDDQPKASLKCRGLRHPRCSCQVCQVLFWWEPNMARSESRNSGSEQGAGRERQMLERARPPVLLQKCQMTNRPPKAGWFKHLPLLVPACPAA